MSEVAKDCPRCGAPNFRFACARCSLLTPVVCEVLTEILDAVEPPITAEKVRASFEHGGNFDADDIIGILRAIRMAPPRAGFSFPLWDPLRALRRGWQN